MAITSQNVKTLYRYGYLSDGTLAVTDGKYQDAVRNFQQRSGLEDTGVVDKATEDRMNEPRCGMKDIVDKVGVQPRRKKRYVLQGSRWRQKTISYRNGIFSHWKNPITHINRQENT